MDSHSNAIKIGEGGFGTVYRLTGYNPPIVMKIARSKQVDKQRKELSVLKELIHMNIVKYLDHPWDFNYKGDESPIFMEYCEWGSMREVLADPQIKYSVATVVKWGREIFSAVVFLAQKHIIHHDLKLDNIFLATDFVAKIGDFGVMKRVGLAENLENRGGTMLYMAPEYRDGLELDERELYKCDVFGAGIALLELIERRSLTARLEAIHFTPSKSPQVTRLQELVKRCSCPRTPIRERCTADEALEELKHLETLFTHLFVDPEIQRHRTILCKAEGLDLVETGFTATFFVPDVTLTTGPRMENLSLSPAIKEQKPKKNHELEYFTHDLLPRIQRKTEFLDFWINDAEIDNHNTSSALNFRLSEDEVMDVNKTRELLGSTFCVRFARFSPDLQPRLIQEMREIFGGHYFLLNPILESPLYFDDEYMEWRFEREHWMELLGLWRYMVVFDLRLQYFSMYFAFHALNHCSSPKLTWVERLKLLNLAIHNIEETEKIFTKRIRYRARTFDDFSAVWCCFDNLAFKKDLSDFRFGIKSEFEMVQSGDRIIIDLEAVRRALHSKREAAIEHAKKEQKIKGYKPRMLKREMYGKSIIHQFLDRMNRRLKSHREKLKPEVHTDLPLLPDYYFPDFPSESKVIQEARRFSETQLPGYIFYFDFLCLAEYFPECKCTPECEIKEFLSFAPIEDLQIQYSTCSIMKQREYLETHSLFERSFRMLSFWPELFSYQYTSFVLLTELLTELETKKDSSFGFAFMFMIERVWQSPQQLTGRSVRSLDDELKRGIMFSFDRRERNSFVNQNFELEPASQDNLWLEYGGLIYLTLDEISKLLELMMLHLRKYQKFKSRIKFSGDRLNEKSYMERLEIEYKEQMKAAVFEFWLSKESGIQAKHEKEG